MKNLKYYLMALVAVFLVSCDGKSKAEKAMEEIKDELHEGMEKAKEKENVLGKDNVKEVFSGEDAGEAVDEGSSAGSASGVLDEYEAYINKFISLQKRVSAGDQSATAAFNALMAEGQALSQKLRDAAPSMTAAQQQRLADLVNKLSKATIGQ